MPERTERKEVEAMKTAHVTVGKTETSVDGYTVKTFVFSTERGRFYVKSVAVKSDGMFETSPLIGKGTASYAIECPPMERYNQKFVDSTVEGVRRQVTDKEGLVWQQIEEIKELIETGQVRV